MDVKKLLRFGCPAAKPQQSGSRPPPPLLGFSIGPKYIRRLECKSSHGLVIPSLASSVKTIFEHEYGGRDVLFQQKKIQAFPYLSEYSLIYSALRAQVLWLIEFLEEISPDDKSFLLSLVNRDNARHITKRLLDAYHSSDVSLYYVEAVRSFLKVVCSDAEVCEMVDSSCTEEDIDGLARGLMLKEALDNVILPTMNELIAAISAMCQYVRSEHLNYIASRLVAQRAEISDCKIGGDFYAAQGSNAQLAQKFVGSLGLSVNPYAYQDLGYAKPLIWGIAIFNTILIDFDALISVLINLNRKFKMDDFARSKKFLSLANSGLSLHDMYCRSPPRKEGALRPPSTTIIDDLSLYDKYLCTPPGKKGACRPLASSTSISFMCLIEDLVRSLVGYQITLEGIRKA